MEKKVKRVMTFALIALLILCVSMFCVLTAPKRISAEETEYSGTLSLNQTSGAMVQSITAFRAVYSNTWVDVQDDEDLVIEYDMLSSGNFTNFGIVKGLQSTSNDALNYDAYLEAVMAMDASFDQLHSGFFSSLTLATDITNSSRSQAVKDYMTSNRSKYYASDRCYNLRFKTTGWGNNLANSGCDNYNGLTTGFYGYPHKGLATAGFTYKHIFYADGHYEMWIKSLVENRGVPCNTYTLMLQTAPTFNDALNTAGGYTVPADLQANDEKIFINRSGYFGFVGNANSSNYTLEIDNFSIKTQKDNVVNTVVSENFDSDGNAVYNVERCWGYTGTGTSTWNCALPDSEDEIAEYLDGSVNLKVKSSWSWASQCVYYDTPVTVSDSEDLIIQYDQVKNDYEYTGLLKGLVKQGDSVVRTADTDVEGVLCLKSNNYTYTGAYHFNKINDYDASEELKTYLLTNNNYRHEYLYNGVSEGLDFHTLASTPRLSFGAAGYTYKHVFLASGGYECYRKAIGAENSAFVLILKTADTWAEDSFGALNGAPAEKIYTHRSGYVAFVMHGENPKDFIIDNFTVKTSERYVTTLIKDDGRRTSMTSTVADRWGGINGYAVGVYDNSFLKPEMTSGASVRVVAGDVTTSGIKYRTNVNTDAIEFITDSIADGGVVSVTYGTLITYKDLLDAADISEFTKETLTAAGVKYKEIIASGFNPDCDTENSKGFYGSLVNIRSYNYYRDVACVGYVQLTYNNGNSEYFYADYIVSNARSVYTVAKTVYPVESFSTEQNEILKSYIDGVAIVSVDGETVSYAGGVADYVPPYSGNVSDGVLTITSTEIIRNIVVNGVWVDPATVSEDGRTVTYILN